MPKQEKSASELIIDILKENGKMFMPLKRLAFIASADTKRKLGIYRVSAVREIKAILEPQVEGSLVFNQKGPAFYIVIPCDPEELVLKEFSPGRSKSPLEIARSMPFVKKECKVVLNELVRKGYLRVVLNDILEPRLFLADGQDTPKFQNATAEYTQEEFINAFNSLDNGRIFVRICDLRRKLNWPREDFDNMLKDLRNKKVIQLHAGDASLMTLDEIRDCFIDENNFRMGTVTLHAN